MMSKLRRFRAVLANPAEDRTLDEKLFVSGMFSGLEYAVNILCRLISTLILTRLLTPEIYGLFAIIMTFQVIVVMLTDFGIRSLIIVSDDAHDRDFLRTCWSVQAARGVGIYGIILIIALTLWMLQQADMTPDGSVYASAELAPALAIAGFQLVLQGLESVNQHVYAREMKFGRICLLNIVKSAFSPVVTILIALIWPSVWALVIAGLLTGTLAMLMTFFLFKGPAMGICWQKEHARELYDRGKWIISHSGLTVVTTTADRILLSIFLPASTLGIYTLAVQMIDIPRLLLDKIQHTLFLQVFQSLGTSGDATEMRRKYYGYRIPFDILACMAAGGFMTASPALIDLMYDPRYAQAGEIMQILAIGLPFVGMGIIREAFSAQKRFRLMTLVSLVQAGSIWIGLIVALPVMGSMLGAFLVIALYRLPEFLVLLGLARRENWILPLKEIRFLPIVAVGAALGLGVDYLWSLVDAAAGP